MEENIKELIRTFPEQAVNAIKESKISVEDADKAENIVLAGMGGSGVVGNILQDIVDFKLPFVVNKGYDLPGFVSSKTLLFAVSYSGNTEETLQALQSSRRKNAKIVAITSNGKMEEIARAHNIPMVRMPKRMIPRFTVIFQLFAVLHVLHSSGIIKLKKQDLEEAVKMLKKDYSKTAEELARKLRDKFVIVYTSPKLKGVGLYWKQALNENAKIPALTSTFPELNHNEIETYTKNLENYHVIILRDEKESMRINKRIDLMKNIIKKSKAQISEIVLKGESQLAKNCSAIKLGAMTSAELADMTDVDASKTELLDEFKLQLGK